MFGVGLCPLGRAQETVVKRADFLNNSFMFTMLFFLACYLMRWSVNLLSGESAVGPVETLSLFGVGMLTVLLAAWAGLRALS